MMEIDRQRNKMQCYVTCAVLGLSMMIVSCRAHQAQSTVVTNQPKSGTLPNVVVRPFVAKGLAENDVSSLADKFCTDLSQYGKAELTCPGDLGKVLQHKELELLFGQCSDENCLSKIGEEVKADLFVLGSIAKVGEMYIVKVDLADAQSGKIKTRISHEVESGNVEDLLPAMKEVADKVAASF